MDSTPRKARLITFLTIALVASIGLSLTPPAEAGPISDMVSRYRQRQMMKLPPVDPPFSKKPVKDLNVRTASISSRLKKRFTFKRESSSGVIPFQDSNVNRTSR